MKLSVGEFTFTAQRIFCIGQNYPDHVKEMKGEVPKSPVIFCKPPTSLVAAGEKIPFPKHGDELHHEVEVVVLIGEEGGAETKQEAYSLVAGVTLGLDLTLRDVQRDLKRKGHPWEVAKSFDGSAPIGGLVPYGNLLRLDNIEFTCRLNGEIRQRGNTREMIFPMETLIMEISRVWRLRPGDLIYTGTPSGVGPLKVGDQVSVESPTLGSFSWEIV